MSVNIVMPDGDLKRNVSPMVAELLIRNGGRILELKPININHDETRRSTESSGVPRIKRTRKPRGSENKV